MKYGINARVGNLVVFSRQGAIEAFKNFAKYCYNNLSLESSCVLSDCALDMHKLGFSWDEIEALEIESIIE